jgi:hypothetical protein
MPFPFHSFCLEVNALIPHVSVWALLFQNKVLGYCFILRGMKMGVKIKLHNAELQDLVKLWKQKDKMGKYVGRRM